MSFSCKTAIKNWIKQKKSYPLKLSKKCVHLREYTKKELKQKFRKGGFKKIKVLPFWIGVRSQWFGLGHHLPPWFLERLCRCWFVEAVK